jgi:DNA helicase-2/ATP-dependent DNA helicase PcrA
MAIACVYCDGAHATAGEVKACWTRSQAGGDRRPSPERVVAEGIRRGPHPLGRNVVVGEGQDAPDDWTTCERIRIDTASVGDPLTTVERLRAAAVDRRGVVVELADDTVSAAVERRPAHELGARFAFDGDELNHLVWSNSVDVRDPAVPRWWLVDRAVALGAALGGDGDVVLTDGSAAWLDGGPVRFTEPIDGVPVLPSVSVEHGSLTPALSNFSSADLAPDQLAAVTHPGGAARIIAPAGSGKTRVLTERARHLLVGWRLPPSAVSLVAFNKRAQEEMRERTADLPGLQVRTLNAIALAVVNGVPPFLAQPRSWRTIDEPDVRRLLSKLVGFPKRRNTDPVAPWIEALSAIRLGLADPLDVERRYNGDVDGLTEVWPKYRAELERERVVDFDDQIYRAIGILVGQPEARVAAQRSCRVMLVDEFQDLTPAHLLLVRLLSAPGGAVFGVGDDDQTIYGYNGADPGWLIDFAELFPSAGDHPLEVNYRCPAGVVVSVDRLLRHNRRRVNKTIRAASDEPGGWSVDVSGDPVHATAKAVGAAIDAGAAPADIAVLARVNATLAPVQLALVAAGLPVAGGVGLEFAERTSVRAVLAWLRLATGRVAFRPDDLAEALRRPSRPLHPRVAEWVAEQESVAGLRRLAARLNAERDTERVAAFADDIERMQKLAGGGSSTGAVVDVLLDELGLAGAVQTLDATRQGMNRAAQGDDLTAIRQVAALHQDAPTFERWLRDGLAVARDVDGVVLATVHRVKGQEWPHVIVHLADDDQYPHRLADDVEEERRLLHVAITRARRHATIVTGRRPSPFIAELTTEPTAELVTERPTARPERARVATAPPRTTGSDHPLLDRSTVLAAPGLVLVDQGTEWAVSEVDDEAVVAVQGGATRRFAIGSQVVTVGRQRGALQLPPPSARPESVWAYDELRRFRESARNGKPAYVVFDDKTLAAIADALPSTLVDLARVKGVGPAKLEQYGDAVLALVTSVTDR